LALDHNARTPYARSAITTTDDPKRVHLIGHASPIGPDMRRFGLSGVEEYVRLARSHLPRPLRLTCDLRLLKAVEDPWHGGRHDDGARVRDLQQALGDPRTLAIVAASGGAYFSRILPELDFGCLAGRRSPLWALGFSEMSTLVGVIASYRCGRGLYWLSPNWLGWRIRPPDQARAALEEFWRTLPAVLSGRVPGETRYLDFGPVRGELVTGKAESGRMRIVGGCLAVLAAVLGGRIGRRLRPDGKWLLLEDIKESPYRIDRHLAALKHAGWFERAAGLLVGDFRMMHEDTQPAVLELLKYHLPGKRRLPVVTTRRVGHVWPMVPVLLNRPLEMEVRGRAVTLTASGLVDDLER
jgi:muramoyltetrapeptide carboxypeptidase